MACWFNYPDDASARANIICSSTGSLIFCHAIILGRVDCCSVSFVSSKFLFSLLASSA
jgi:hypothetical protein